MAFALGRLLGTGTSKTANQASTTLTTIAALNSGELGILIVAVDNNQTTDGDEGAVTSVTDSAGNSWAKGGEFCNGQALAQAGATCSLWYTNATSTMASSGTVTINFSNATSRDASATTAAAFTKVAANATVEGTPAGLADDAADPGALNVTTSNIECLRIRGIATETSTTSPAFTKTAAFTGTFTDAVSSGGAGSTNMAARGEYAISTGTSLSSDPTLFGATDHASIYVAFKEATSPNVTANPTGNAATGAAGTFTVSGKANTSVTGVNATGAAGTPTVALNTPVSITGNAATGSAGTPTISGKANVTPTGVSGTGSSGTPTVSGKATTDVTGVAATGASGDVTVSGKANASVTGVAASGAVGTPAVSGQANVSIGGNEATGQAGVLTITLGDGSVIATLEGVVAAWQVGTLTAAGDATVGVDFPWRASFRRRHRQ